MPITYQDLKKYLDSLGSLVLCRLPHLGRYDGVGLDDYERATTVGGSPKWEYKNGGYGFSPRADGRISVADGGTAPELQITAGTLIVFSPGFVAGTGQRFLISKYDGGGIAYVFYFLGNDILVYTDGTSTLAAPGYPGKRFAAASMAPGVLPKFYLDGAFVGNGNVIRSPVVDDAALTIGNDTGGTVPCLSSIQAAFIFNAVLTDEQIAQIYDLLIRMAPVDRQAPIIASGLPTPSEELGMPEPIIRFAGPQTSGGQVPDLGPSGLAATLGGVVTVRAARDGRIWYRGRNTTNAGNGRAQTAADASLDPATWTHKLTAICRGAGEGGYGVSFATTQVGTPHGALACWGLKTLWAWIDLYAGGSAVWTFPFPDDTLEHRVVIKHNRQPGTLPRVWIDGVEVTVTLNTASSGAYVPAASPVLTLLNSLNAGTYPNDWDGDVSEYEMVSGELSDALIRRDYVDWAARPIIQGAREAFPVSLAGVTAGQVGPWYAGSGTWQWQDDGEQRVLVNSVAGYVSCPSSQAYGGWYFTFEKADASVLDVLFVAAVRSGLAGASQAGYALRVAADETVSIVRVTAGAVAATVLTSAAGFVAAAVKYEAYVSRRSNGLLSLYIRGGAFSDWTAVGTPAADTTHTTSNFTVLDNDASDEVSDMMWYKNGYSLDPTAGDLDQLLDG